MIRDPYPPGYVPPVNTWYFDPPASIECKDLEWLWDGQVIASQSVRGVDGYYFVYYFDQKDAFEVHYQPYNGNYHHRVYIGTRDSFPSAQAAANDHNKKQFQSIIEQWRKG